MKSCPLYSTCNHLNNNWLEIFIMHTSCNMCIMKLMMYMHEMCFVPIYAWEIELHLTLWPCMHRSISFHSLNWWRKKFQNPAPTLQEDYKPPRWSKLQILNHQHPPFISNITMSVGASTLLLGSLNLVLPNWGKKY